MGIYINPGNHGFAEINDTEYVDKTLLIDLVNQTIGGKHKLTCVSRPRRFGKSYAARMLTAYYDCSCDSHSLFDGRNIAETPDYRKHLNKYNVICLDITGFISAAQREGASLKLVPQRIVSALRQELEELNPDLPGQLSLEDALIRTVEAVGGKPFIFIIDEWDALIREAKEDEDVQKRYINLLRGWFKNINFTPRVVAAAYMTGILPIKKDGTESAVSDFEEYTMLRPYRFAEYVGFTEDEVRQLCRDKGISFTVMKQWYDGYAFQKVGSVYNPGSVMKAIRYHEFASYWTETSAAEGLLEYISQDYNGLSKTIAELVGGVRVQVNTNGFANDLTTFRGKDDVLTLLVHLGYLAYDPQYKTVRIPNEEIKQEFQSSIHEVRHEETRRRLEESEKLFADTIGQNEEAVAAQIEKIHVEETVPLYYNREDSLRSVIKLAYYTYRDHYLQWEELPSGTGYADIVYLPKKDSDWPALVVELKWNKSAEGAIEQIKNRRYFDALKGYRGEILLVGVSYDKDPGGGGKHHTCRIEKIQFTENG